MTKTYSFGDLGKNQVTTISDKYALPDSVSNKQMLEDMKYWSDKLVKQYTIPISHTPNYNYHYPSIDYDSYHKQIHTAKVNHNVQTINVTMDDHSIETISREELVKYIGELKLIQSNEVVRKMYDRFQVAAKLARSDDNGDTGV